MESSPHSPQLERKLMQQQRCSTAKNKMKMKKYTTSVIFSIFRPMQLSPSPNYKVFSSSPPKPHTHQQSLVFPHHSHRQPLTYFLSLHTCLLSHPHQHLLLSIFLIKVTLVGMKFYFMVLTNIFLMPDFTCFINHLYMLFVCSFQRGASLVARW